MVRAATAKLAETSSIDADQVLAYDLAHTAASLETARSMIDYGAKGDLEAQMTCVFVADVIAELAARLWGREKLWGAQPDALASTADFVATWRDPARLADLAFQDSPRHLDAEFDLVSETFRRFAEDRVVPEAEHIHRTNADIPESLISGLAEMGLFLSLIHI